MKNDKKQLQKQLTFPKLVLSFRKITNLLSITNKLKKKETSPESKQKKRACKSTRRIACSPLNMDQLVKLTRHIHLCRVKRK